MIKVTISCKNIEELKDALMEMVESETAPQEGVGLQYGELVQLYRKKKGVSQYDLGKAIGLDQGKISQIEIGNRHARFFEMVNIAKALGVPVTFLIPR